MTTILLSSVALYPSAPPPIPPSVELGAPYVVSVPSGPALSVASLQVKSTLWPVLLTPPRKTEPEVWTRDKVEWAEATMRFVVAEAIRGLVEDGEVS